ncbi:MAG: phosphoribosylamine--glycine ligase [Pseudomonadota bacterium]
MKVLLIGGGGREHALAWAITNSSVLDRLYCAPGNAGIAELAEIVPLDITDHGAVIAFCRETVIDLVVVGPEAPLVAGLVDDLAAAGVRAFGPTKAAALLEGSKAFTKEICDAAGIPTASYASFADADAAKAHIREHGAPIVVKADGLAAGKGVVVASTVGEALEGIDQVFAPGSALVIEELLTGEEASFFALCDGETALPLATAQDHKRAFDHDTGPNTGGMGAYSPAPILTPALCNTVMETIIQPTLKEMNRRGTPFKGVLYAGLMIDQGVPRLLEYNVRFGDPECQVLMLRLKDDILLLMRAAADGTLSTMSARWYDETALTVVMATRGYPGAYERGSEIAGLENVSEMEDVEVFHAGTTRGDNDRVLANGGRVLAVTALGPSVRQAQAHAYEAIARLDWPEGYYRRDIGWRAIAAEEDTT